MMRSIVIRSLLALAILSPQLSLAQETGSAKEESATSTAAASRPSSIGEPPEGKGQIVFFRPSRAVGAMMGFKVREGETELGKLSNGRYFVHVTEPGKHEYTVHAEVKDVLPMEIEEGETYYVMGSLSFGLIAGRPNLSPSDESIFSGAVAKMKPAKK